MAPVGTEENPTTARHAVDPAGLRVSDRCEHGALAGRRVLHVDGDAEMRFFVAALLDMHGAEVVSVETASEAVDYLVAGRADVVLSDHAIPRGEAGSAACARPPAIAFSSFRSREDRKWALADGFDEHVVKGAPPGELLATIVRVIEAFGDRGPAEPSACANASVAAPTSSAPIR